MIATDHVIALSGLLFVIGLLGAILRRHLIAVLLSLQLMLAASNLALMGFGRHWSGPGATLEQDPQVFALLVLVVGAAELVVGLAIVVTFVRSRKSIDMDDASLLRW